MADEKTCGWLMDNAGAPIRHRVARELLGDASAAKKIEGELFDDTSVRYWLEVLKPAKPPQRRSMAHGGFDFCFENAMLKLIQLGMHAKMRCVREAVGYYTDIIKKYAGVKPARNTEWYSGFDLIIISNILARAEADFNPATVFLLDSLDEMHRFTLKGKYDIYYSEREKAALKGVPKIWKDKKFIRNEIIREDGFCYPFIYDLIGLGTLYKLNDQTVASKADAVVGHITSDAFNSATADGYGILDFGAGKYYSQGWDPKYPGWFDAADYLENCDASKMLFFAQYISKYPAACKTKWYGNLLTGLEKYRIGAERGAAIYKFPAGWLKETKGYAVLGSHMSFGENRKKKNWREIESTFYMQSIL